MIVHDPLLRLRAPSCVVAALGVITARNPVHCALFLVFAFLNSAVIWLLLEAEFLAITLVVVYVGAVMVLFLFVVMMLDVNVEKLRQGFTRYAPLGALIALVVVAQIGHRGLGARPRARAGCRCRRRSPRATRTRPSSASCSTRSTCIRSSWPP